MRWVKRERRRSQSRVIAQRRRFAHHRAPPRLRRDEKEGKMRRFALALATILAVASASPADAQSRCKVMDPTGTPLNLRAAPDGKIVATLPNGALVSVVQEATGANGKPWAYVARYEDDVALGWVFREFIACY
jgi:hypothetical protein